MALPKCPYCEHEFDSEEIYYTGRTTFPTENDGDTTETQCLECDTPLTIALSLEPSWRFLNDDGEEA